MPKATVGPMELLHGYFYSLYGGESDPDYILSVSPEEREPAIISDVKAESQLYMEVMEEDSKELHWCPQDPQHVTGDCNRALRADFCGGSNKTAGFVRTTNSPGFMLVAHPLVERLKKADLKGLLFDRVEVTIFGDDSFDPSETGSDPHIPRLYNWNSLSRSWPWAIPRIEPLEEDCCPFCGYSPLICQGCGELHFECPKCHQECLTYERRSSMGARQLERDEPRQMIDPRRWDGSDACQPAGLVTRRLIDFLLSIHAGPFVAFSVPTNVYGLHPKERQRLELAKKPVEG